jgi:hypothetical protein
VKVAQTSVLQLLQESVNGFQLEEVVIVYDPASMWSPWRPLMANAVVAISDQTNAEGKLLSKFATSTLFQRGAVPGLVQCMPRREFSNWIAENDGLDAHSDITSELRQHHSGTDMWVAVLRSLTGHLPANTTAAVRDLSPADDSLSNATMILNQTPRALPRFCYSGVVWENFVRQSGGIRLAENLNYALLTNLKNLVDLGSYRSPGIPSSQPPQLPANAANRPSLQTEYDLCMVVGSKHLAIKQSRLDQWAKQLPDIESMVADVVREHNAAANQGGASFKENTRPAPTPLEAVPEAIAKPASGLPALPGQVADYAQLGAAAGNFEVSAKTHKLVATSEGDLYLVALSDCVIESDTPLFTVKGKFWTGGKAQEFRKSGPCISYAFDSSSVICPEDATKKNIATLADMPQHPMPLGQYLTLLLQRGHVLFKLRSHSVARKANSTEFDVNCEGETVLENSLPKANQKVRPTLANFSQWVHVAGLLSSDRVCVQAASSLF